MTNKKIVWFLSLFIIILALVACGGGGNEGSQASAPAASATDEPVPVSAGDPVVGKEQYDMICIACHGPDGGGIEGLGKPFTTSDFLREKNDNEMLEFIKVGRPSGDPLNTTGVDMPPKGGNPALNDEHILDIIAYVRTLQN